MAVSEEHDGGTGAPPGTDPVAPPAPRGAPARGEPVVVPRWIQLVALPLIVLGAWALARAAGAVLLLFVVSALIALLLNPFVTLLRRIGFPRGLAVLTVFLALIVVVGSIVAL